MLNKLFDAYALFISAMNKGWLNYTYANLRNTIYQIIWYLKNDLLKILYIAFITRHSTNAHSNKRQRITCISRPALPVCK